MHSIFLFSGSGLEHASSTEGAGSGISEEPFGRTLMLNLVIPRLKCTRPELEWEVCLMASMSDCGSK